MPRLCNANAVIVCPHTSGIVNVTASQQAVRIGGAPALRINDVPTWAIRPGCPQVGIGLTPCAKVMALTVGGSAKVIVGGQPALLDTAQMTTNGVPVFTPATVTQPGQVAVSAGG